MDIVTKEKLSEQLDRIRAALIDLTRNNSLVHYKPTAKSIKVVGVDPAEVFTRLVLKADRMSFQQQPKYLANEQGKAPTVKRRQQDAHLDVALEGAAMQKRLRDIASTARSTLDDAGYTSLYLAVGFLNWVNEKRLECSSPILLIPVELEQHTLKPWYLRWTGGEVEANPCLPLLFPLLPEPVTWPVFSAPDDPDDKAEVSDYFESLRSAIGDREGWSLSEDIYLGFFEFDKVVMYRDLDPDGWPEGQ